MDREQYRAGPARPARAYTRGLYCFQPKGSPTAWISGDAKASHYVPGQSQRWRPCQRPSQRVAFSLIGGPLTAPAGAVRGIRFCFPPTSWRALLDARLFRWFPVLLICSYQRTRLSPCLNCRGNCSAFLETIRHIYALQTYLLKKIT